MTFLGWMRHKFKHSNKEPFKDFSTANSFLDGQENFSKPFLGSRHRERGLSQHPRQLCGASFSEFNPSATAAWDSEDEASFDNGDIFRGFLTIGTLGSEQLFSEPETPLFNELPENAYEEKTDMSETDLKFLNSELEKFLQAETEEGLNETSGRNSYVSIITICDAVPIIEGTKGKKKENTVEFPLQGYLFGSSIEFQETRKEMKKEKTSLGDLFRRTRAVDGSCKEKHKKIETQTSPKHKSTKRTINKILKNIVTSPKSNTASRKNSCNPAKKKLQKVVQMLYRKIHPENSKAAGEANYYSRKLEIKQALSNEGCIRDNFIHLDVEERCFTYDPSTNQDLIQVTDPGSGVIEGQWITTDADYLVLEL